MRFDVTLTIEVAASHVRTSSQVTSVGFSVVVMVVSRVVRSFGVRSRKKPICRRHRSETLVAGQKYDVGSQRADVGPPKLP